MVEYGAAIDAQISQLLASRGRVTPDMVAGVEPNDAAELLQRYVEVHSGETPLVFDGNVLTWASQPTGAVDSGYQPTLSPVDQVSSLSRTGSLLDSPPSGGKVPGWLWVAVFFLGAPGGVLAWFVARDTNRQTARTMLIAGIVVTVISACVPLAFLPSLGFLGGGASAEWPASTTGRPTFYYFGTPN